MYVRACSNVQIFKKIYHLHYKIKINLITAIIIITTKHFSIKEFFALLTYVAMYLATHVKL